MNVVDALVARVDDGRMLNWVEQQRAVAEIKRLHAEIDAAWFGIKNGWDIENRAYFERESKTNGFGSALAQAVHHMWKRRVKENHEDILREMDGVVVLLRDMAPAFIPAGRVVRHGAWLACRMLRGEVPR